MKLSKFIYGIENPELKKEISDKLNDIKQNAEQDIGFAAKENVNPKSILFTVWSKAKAIKAIVTTHFEPEISKLKTQIKEVDLDNLKTSGLKQQEQIKKEIGAVDIDIKRTQLDFDWAKRKWARIGIVACLCLDAIINFRAWQVLVENLLISGIVAVLTACGLSYGVHQVAIRVTAAKTKREKIIWIVGGLAGGAGIFFLLGLLRQKFYGNDGSLMASPLLWTLWNLFFYGIALLLAINNTPTKEQRLAYEKLEEKKNEQTALENKLRLLQQKITVTETAVKEWKEKLSMIEKYQEELLNSVDMERNLICAECIKEYELKGGTISFTQMINELKKQDV
jgi:hypothetical protein